MKRINIGKDERYPDYYMSIKPNPADETIEISDELYADLELADKAYSTAQAKLAELYKQQK